MMSDPTLDDEPDYMSDDFLAKCIPEDVRPGLKRVRSKKCHKYSSLHRQLTTSNIVIPFLVPSKST